MQINSVFLKIIYNKKNQSASNLKQGKLKQQVFWKHNLN